MPINPDDFEIVKNEVSYEKKTFQDITKESKEIDVEIAAREILIWAANNVEEFIDNQRKIFKLDLIIDAEDGATESMPAIRKLQDLYRAIPEDPELDIENLGDEDATYDQLTDTQKGEITKIQRCRAVLDTVTNDVYLCMKTNEDLRSELFKRMAFYYEMKGLSSGNLLIDALSGEVDVNKFEYEAFPVGVQVRSPIVERKGVDGNLTKEGGKIINEYVIPEGFTLWLEIAFKAKNQQMGSMF